MQEFLEKAKSSLRLENWDITLILHPALDSQGATKTVYNEYLAVIRVSADLSDGTKKLTILHELLHCVNRDSNNLADEYIKNSDLNALYCRYHERAIEQTAKALYFLIEGRRYVPQEGM
jgi:hypothetical protein